MQRTYICKNGVRERTRYAVGDSAKARRRRQNKTSFRKQEQNFNSAIRKCARILNCNFSHENGVLVTLTYSDEGLGKLYERVKPQPGGEADVHAAADREMMLYLRRVKQKHKLKLKYLAVTSEMDEESKLPVRIHHHVVLAIADRCATAEALREDLQRAWGFGRVDARQLREQPDYTPIAVYLMQQVRRDVRGEKKYHVSRGMEQPVTEEREIVCNSELRVQPGATVLERSVYSADQVCQYIRYIPRRREKNVGREEVEKACERAVE